ncbi:hypothetical protein DSAG12_00678 [Promethearchaeum syntrophicum]|uniref:V4R domain protein n=1 Tax=Promethearchaeum syntrophicum TaxID=2594042 RepID=A0A5B9D6S6_9ARCH|nr:hypothetical protein [Candidatus Prometheoarchaeum syntrophicum]QEE14858.1 hypothetical protein DSAG12_00678 [Candidatus Prometheoarchaeum syntrophicum]
MKNIEIDPIKSHIKIKTSNLPLVILRPSDLFEFHMLLQTNIEESLYKIGNVIGDSLWTSLNPKLKKKKIDSQMKYLLDLLYQMGYGKLLYTKKKRLIKISINSSIIWDNYPQLFSLKSIAELYFGLFLSFFKENRIFGKEEYNINHEKKTLKLIFQLNEE